MIILTKDQTEKVRGRSPADSHAALDPVPLKDGTFILGEAVLKDPAHADVADFLGKLPRVAAVDVGLRFDPDTKTDDKAALDAMVLPDWKAIGVRLKTLG